MNLISRLMQGLTGTGAHRAADRIPELEADRDYWRAVALEASAKLAHADELLTRVCEAKNVLLIEKARLTAELDVQAEGHRLLELENDELAVRLTATRQDLANALAISSPALADRGPAIPLYNPDAATTAATTLWNAHGLRPNALAQQAA